MSRFLSEQFNGISPYVPGEQPRDMQYIKLNANENPFPPSPNAMSAVTRAECEDLNLYSDADVKVLINEIAKNKNVKPENVIVGNGSDEILAFAFLAFGGKKNMTFADLTYSFYPVYAKLYGLKSRVIPLNEQFELDERDYLVDGENVIIANPNAPTGKMITTAQIETVLKAHKNDIVMIDEAYVDFGGTSVVPLIEQYDNLLVIQTFSKSRSLAGARLGFGIASAPIIADLNKMKFSFNPFNINRLSMIIGAESMRDTGYFNDCTEKIIATREKTTKELRALGFEVIDSHTNFIFVTSKKIDGEAYYKALKEKGVLIRWFNQDRIRDFVRITIGTEQQMDILLEKTREILN